MKNSHKTDILYLDNIGYVSLLHLIIGLTEYFWIKFGNQDPHLEYTNIMK